MVDGLDMYSVFITIWEGILVTTDPEVVVLHLVDGKMKVHKTPNKEILVEGENNVS